MQVQLLFFAAICLTAVSAQSGPRKVRPINRNNRDVNELQQFNGYNYQAPAITFPEPIFNQQQQQQQEANQNFGFTGSQDSGQFQAPAAPALLHTSAPKEVPAVQNHAHHVEEQAEHKVQTVRIIHENRANGHTNTNVKTVRIIQDPSGHRGSSSHGGQVQTVRIVHEERPPAFTTYTTKHAEPHTKTVRIVHDTSALTEVQGRSADQYSTFKIIQDGAASVHAPLEETQSVQFIENPAGSYGGAQVHEEIRTLQTLQEAPALVHHQQNAIVKYVDQPAATGYTTGQDTVILRVVPGGEAVGYQNAYVSNGGYNAVAQEPCPLPYHQHQQLETIKLGGSHAIPQQQTFRYLQSNKYPTASHYGGNAEIDSILKFIQSSGIGAGLGGHGHVKLRILNK